MRMLKCAARPEHGRDGGEHQEAQDSEESLGVLFSARQAYASARYNYLRNRLLLEQAAGTLDATTVQDINRLLTIDTTAPAPQQQ